MSKMSDLDLTIKELRDAARGINEAANWLALQFSGDGEVASAPIKETKTETFVTLEQVRAVLADKSRQGHTAEIRALLQEYGGSKLSQIDPKNYEALLLEAEEITDET